MKRTLSCREWYWNSHSLRWDLTQSLSVVSVTHRFQFRVHPHFSLVLTIITSLTYEIGNGLFGNGNNDQNLNFDGCSMSILNHTSMGISFEYLSTRGLFSCWPHTFQCKSDKNSSQCVDHQLGFWKFCYNLYSNIRFIVVKTYSELAK